MWKRVLVGVLLSLAAGCGSSAPPPAIPDRAVAETEELMEAEALIDDAHVGVDGDTVTIALVANHAAKADVLRDLLDSAARYLASQVPDVDRPDGDSLGGLWDHYTLHVGAGPSAEDLRVQGAKVPSSPHISW